MIKYVSFIVNLFLMPLYVFSLENFTTQQNISLDNTIHYTVDWENFIVSVNVHTKWSDAIHNIPSMQEKTYKEVTNTLPQILSLVIDSIPVSKEQSLLQFITQQDDKLSSFLKVQQNTTLIHHIPDDTLFGSVIQYSINLKKIMKNIIFPSISTIPLPTTASIYGILDNTEYSALIFSVPIELQNSLNEKKIPSFTPKMIPLVFAPNGVIVYTPEYFEGLNNAENAVFPFQYIFLENVSSYDLGENPLFIYPITMTESRIKDMILSKRDAQFILGNKTTQNLIRSGKVFFVLDKQLSSNISHLKNKQ